MSEHLYDLNKNSATVKFYKWLWDVDPTVKFKTMCPYFWSYIGSIIILPLILLSKLIFSGILPPIIDYCEKLAKASYERFLERVKLAETDEECARLYVSRCFRKYQYQMDYDCYLKLCIAWNKFQDSLPKKEEKEPNITFDEFRHGPVGTFMTYLLGAIVLALFGWFIYWFLHLFTWDEFVHVMIKIGAGLALIIGVIFLLVGGYFLYDATKCGTFVDKAYISIGHFFKTIGSGISIFFDMIANLYKKSCPIIHWKE